MDYSIMDMNNFALKRYGWKQDVWLKLGIYSINYCCLNCLFFIYKISKYVLWCWLKPLQVKIFKWKNQTYVLAENILQLIKFQPK